MIILKIPLFVNYLQLLFINEWKLLRVLSAIVIVCWIAFFVEFTVEFSNFVSRVWAQIVKRVVVRFYWNFNTMIWHLYVFILATWKKFPITEDFSTTKKWKNKAVFRNFETSVNLYEIFYVMKVVGKIRVGIFSVFSIRLCPRFVRCLSETL